MHIAMQYRSFSIKSEGFRVYVHIVGSSSAGENSASTVYTPKQILRNQDNLIREEIFKRDVQLHKIDSLEEDKGMVIPLTPHNSMY